jgi:hypothetical protein
MHTKTCSKCGEVKPLSQFNSAKKEKYGKAYWCMICSTTYQRDWRKNNPGKNSEYERRYFAKPGMEGKKAEKWDAYYAKNKCTIRSDRNARKRANPALRSFYEAKRRTIKKHIPAWANRFFMLEIYDLARRRTKASGIKHHVDHIVPLQNKNVCGLHCEQNLMVIPALQNYSKGSRRWPEMP